MKKLLILIILIGISINGYAQNADLLINKNDTISIYTYILHDYLSKIETKDTQELGEFIGRGYDRNCPRDYYVIYKIQNDSLFIDKIISCNNYIDRRVSVLQLLKNKRINGKVFIDWYSGDISSQRPQLFREANLKKEDFKPIVVFQINKGIVVKILYNGLELMHLSDKANSQKLIAKRQKLKLL